MRIVPDSTVNLYANVDIDMASGVQIAFSSIANQRSYFNSKIVRTSTPCTVIKKTGRLRLEIAGSVVSGCNYISFVNPSFDNKTIYARITDYEYINNECTEISYLIDFWQTWMFDVSFEKCGIARQYLNETDFNKAATNPYDPSIYAFRTPEDLSYDRSLEKPAYKYQGSTIDYPTKDGDYIVAENNYDTTNLQPALNGQANSIVIFLSPIDFADLGQAAEDSWQTFYEDVTNDPDYRPHPGIGGTYLDVNEIYTGDNDIVLSNMPRGYIVIEMPKFNSQETMDVFNDFISYMTGWNAINQIIGVYVMPTWIFKMAFVDPGQATSPQWQNLVDNNVVSFPTSDNRTKGGLGYNPHCKKLLTFPYSYMRMETTDGSTKEYHYEDFSEVWTGAENTCKFKLYCDLNGNPTFCIVPFAYKEAVNVGSADIDGVSISLTTLASYNLAERLEIASFPQVPFITDAYLTYLSKEYMAAVASNNIEAQDSREQQKRMGALGMITSALGVTSPTNEAGSIQVEGNTPEGNIGYADVGIPNVSNAGNIVGGFMSSARNYTKAKYMDYRLNEAQTMLAGHANGFQRLANGTQEYGRFNDTRPAFANNVYHPGVMSGKLQFIKGMMPIDIKLTHVQLNTKVLQKYDEYFKTFGYNVAGEIDVPYVVKYTQGASSNDDVPHWEQVNGKDSTYVRTQDCHVTHSMLPVSMTIEAMFNSGVRMLKGETL